MRAGYRRGMSSYWAGKVVIVTGAASGIGRALSDELVKRGAAVVAADIADIAEIADIAHAAPLEVAGRRRLVKLDVSDARAVKALVDDVVARHGKLDAIFNNAGVSAIGLAEEIDESHWQRLLDVNLGGVRHGVSAAYPVMKRQGFGHIVNTASLAGIVPLPLQLPYATTKFAVVGLSLALRTEALNYGVNVSVACPGVVDTAIYRSVPIIGHDRERFLQTVPLKQFGISAEACARAILRGVEKKRAVVVVTAFAKFAWWLYRLAPWLALRAGAAAALRTTTMTKVETRA